MSSQRLLTLALACGLGVACTQLRSGPLEGQDTPDADGSSSGEPGTSSGEPGTSSGEPGTGSSGEPGTSSGSSGQTGSSSGQTGSSSGGQPAEERFGAAQLITDKVAGSIGVAVTGGQVHWREANNCRSNGCETLWRQLPVGEVCPVDTNCGGYVTPLSGFGEYFDRALTPPVAGSGWACIGTLFNAANNSEIVCAQGTSGLAKTLSGSYNNATTQTFFNGALYFSVSRYNTATKSSIRRLPLVPTPASLNGAAVETLIEREAKYMHAVAADAYGIVWLEQSGDTNETSLWHQKTDGAPQQLASARAGAGDLALDRDFVYVTRGAEGIVLRYSRTDGTERQVATAQRVPTAPTRQGQYLYWLNIGSGPSYINSSIVRSKLDGSAPEVISEEQKMYHMAVHPQGIHFLTNLDTETEYRGSLWYLPIIP